MRFARILNLPDMLFFMKVDDSQKGSDSWNCIVNCDNLFQGILIVTWWWYLCYLFQVIEKSDNIRLAQITCQILAVFFMSAGVFMESNDDWTWMKKTWFLLKPSFMGPFLAHIHIHRICPPFGTYGRPLVGSLPGIPFTHRVCLHHVRQLLNYVYQPFGNVHYVLLSLYKVTISIYVHPAQYSGMWHLVTGSFTRWSLRPRVSSVSTWWSSSAWSPLPFLRLSHVHHDQWSISSSGYWHHDIKTEICNSLPSWGQAFHCG